MSTGQLVVLWYAALVVVAILLVEAADSSAPAYLITAVVTLAAVLIYSLKQHPRARKRIVALAVAVPLVALPVLIWAALSLPEYVRRQKERPITREQIELFDTTLNERYGSVYFVGRVRNNSNLTLERLEVEVSINEGSQLVERHVTTVSKTVPPGEARQFEDLLYRLETPVFKDGNWDTRFTPHLRVVKAVGVIPSAK